MSDRPFHLLVDVGGSFRGVHVLNQSGDDNAKIIRHSGLGNRIRLGERGADTQLEVEVGNSWKSAHVRNQSDGDDAELLRHSGDGNPVRLNAQGDGTHNIEVAVQSNGLVWKGIHVYQQRDDNGTSLVRHRDAGNTVIVLPDAPAADPTGDLHLLVEVGGVFKGLHVRDQSTANGANVIRHRGLGNVIRLTPAPEVEGAWRLSIGIDGVFAGLHVLNQSGGDNVTLIRHSGDGNLVRIVKNNDGTIHLLVRVNGDGTEWRGVHIQSQRGDDGTPLIRHQGNGNAFVMVPVPVVVTPEPAPAPEPTPEPAPVVNDDLTIIEGIGPQISALFVAAGLATFAQVAASTPEQLKAILTAGGNRFATANPATWPEQARLAAAGETAELAALQAKLKGGRE